MTLVNVWFILIAVLWTGFFVLEGFDFGVGILHRYLSRDEPDRLTIINTIGPLWDGNEVWLVVAGAAMFAAFPGWYSTMFSAYYLALALILVALILRGVSFEFRGRDQSPRWRTRWSILLTAGSIVAPLLLGVALGGLLHGLPIGADQEYTGDFLDLLKPYPLYVGVTLLALCVLHGATFIALKTTGGVRDRAKRLARQVAPFVAAIVAVYAIWTHIVADKGVLPNPIEIAAILAVIAAAWFAGQGRDGWAFTLTTFVMAAVVVSIFTELFPRVMVSTEGAATDLTISNTASGSYTLKLMTVIFILIFPVVAAYQAWTYHTFRQRLSRTEFENATEE
ncbi:cytochrome d ubiquinol oxidase subunit II [Hamadaea flava]|uniref:Cytochrome d ubiquinol oxidase subunit II n=1 Tax=Hamadaea flava TaxID=1742688 RepID=A0ABV8M0P6_9ACTN|nr:cytochrome d ubiquinol oxidase subunit II [Hamadaea flava]MCP2322186.1 cytochrome d ubiquinol oxidase subunit II [Hamadaea flava]